MAGCVLASAPLFLFVHTHVAIYCDLLLVLHPLAVQYFNSLVVTLAVCSIAIRYGNSLRRLPFGCWLSPPMSLVPFKQSVVIHLLHCGSDSISYSSHGSLPKYCTEYCSQNIAPNFALSIASKLCNEYCTTMCLATCSMSKPMVKLQYTTSLVTASDLETVGKPKKNQKKNYQKLCLSHIRRWETMSGHFLVLTLFTNQIYWGITHLSVW